MVKICEKIIFPAIQALFFAAQIEATIQIW